MHKLAFLVIAPLVVASAGAQSASTEKPTVLPTIIGVRRAPAKQAKAGPSAIPYPATVTAAGPVFVAGPQSDAPVIIEEVPVSVGDGWIDDWGGTWGDRRGFRRRERYEPDRREYRRRDGWERSGAPALAPNPRLAPNPGLPPTPRLAPSPRIR